MKRSGFNIISRLVGLVRPLTGCMILAVVMGLVGHLCASFITILLFDLAMLFLSAVLVGFEGCLIATLALMSSFGPVVALASLGATLQNTFAAGNRVLDILDESPVVEEITGKEELAFCGASAEKVTFAYDEGLLPFVLQDLQKSWKTGLRVQSFIKKIWLTLRRARA